MVLQPASFPQAPWQSLLQVPISKFMVKSHFEEGDGLNICSDILFMF